MQRKSVLGHLIRFMEPGTKGVTLACRISAIENALRHILLEVPELDGPFTPYDHTDSDVGPLEAVERGAKRADNG